MGTTMDADFDRAPGDLWVFGYGSLIWHPGFDFVEKRLATVIGYRRAFCMASKNWSSAARPSRRA